MADQWTAFHQRGAAVADRGLPSHAYAFILNFFSPTRFRDGANRDPCVSHAWPGTRAMRLFHGFTNESVFFKVLLVQV